MTDYGSPSASWYEPPDPVYWCEAGDHDVGEDELIEMPDGSNSCQGCHESLLNTQRKESE